MNNITLDHLNLTVRNIEESVKFYQDLFHYELVEEGVKASGRRYAIIRSGDSMLCMGEEPELMPGYDSIYSSKHFSINHFGLRIHDRQLWEKKLEKFKPQFSYSSPTEYPHSTSWYIYDPNGHEIEVALWDEDKVRFGKTNES